LLWEKSIKIELLPLHNFPKIWYENKRHLSKLSNINHLPKELSLWNKIKYLNLNIFRTRCCKPLIFQTQIILSNRIHSLKYLRSATFGSKDTVTRKSEFVAKTQFLLNRILLKIFISRTNVLILTYAMIAKEFKKAKTILQRKD